jgi:hypothetical protein
MRLLREAMRRQKESAAGRKRKSLRADYVPKGAARRVLRLLNAGRTPLAGVVFNGFREHRSLIDFNYSYGYYKYGRGVNAYGDGHEAYGAKEA